VPRFAAPAERIAPPAGAPLSDRAPDTLATGTPESLRRDLVALLGVDRVLARASDLVRYASDASPYRRFPLAVVMARDAGEVAATLDYGRRTGVPVTLRAAGSSLNGQAQGDGILVDVRRHWRGVSVERDGARARVRPGTVLAHANRVLARHGRRLGPDPASAEVATVGGVIANNSGGMRCGVVADSYRTVRSLSFVLPSGTAFDTAAPGAAADFARAEPRLAAGLEEIRDAIRSDERLAARIARKFEIKNTTGYRLCAFLDADEPLEIFRRLLIGSEGTLAFVSEAVFDTVPVPPRTTVSWVHFRDIDAALEPVTRLVAAGATAVELMVAPALMVASHSIPGTPEHWRELPPESAALLVELGADDDPGLDGAVARAEEILAGHSLLRAVDFTREREAIELAWRVREGMFGLVGALRPPGSALITEDVCVPPARLAEAARDIQELLGRHGFLTGVAGHASAGNLHFMLTPAFGEPAERDRYAAFMEELVELIVDRYDGSLKAEHGTGVNMAPFVEREWGAGATELMWRIKALADPDGVLAPGVVLNRDPEAHLRDLKSVPEIEEEATACVECGFCEPVCPSRDLTLTPRQRIALRREMARQPLGSPVQRALLADYAYDGLDTCAVDGTCALACPLGIDTGALVKRLRERRNGARAERTAVGLAGRWALVESAARAGLRAGGALDRTAARGAGAAAARAVRAVVGTELVPAWPERMPVPAPATLPPTAREGAAAVYFPACVNRIFGAPAGEPAARWLPEALVAVSARAGRPLWIPPDVAGRCCGTPWSSKGFAGGHEEMARGTADAIAAWTDEGRLPLVVDATSCTQGVIEGVLPHLSEAARPDVVDSIEWAHDELLERLEIRERAGRVAVHPPCASRHLGLAGKLEVLARALAEEVDVATVATCCGFAGDRGLLHPELTGSALAAEAGELAGPHDAAVCSNRTCEIGLEWATGEPWGSFALLLERATRPASERAGRPADDGASGRAASGRG